jgi:hypothetical protein
MEGKNSVALLKYDPQNRLPRNGLSDKANRNASYDSYLLSIRHNRDDVFLNCL